MGIYLRAAQILPLQTLTANHSGVGWYLSGVIIQPNMWDKDFTCTGTPRRKQDPDQEPSAATKGPFRGAFDALVLAGDARDSCYLGLRGRNCSPAVFPCFFLLKGRYSNMYIKIYAKPSTEHSHILRVLQTFPTLLRVTRRSWTPAACPGRIRATKLLIY